MRSAIVNSFDVVDLVVDSFDVVEPDESDDGRRLGDEVRGPVDNHIHAPRCPTESSRGRQRGSYAGVIQEGCGTDKGKPDRAA